jgi:hypothetical protein
MTHSHAHSHTLPEDPAPLGPLAARAVVGLLGVIGIAVIVGNSGLVAKRAKG